MEYSDGKIIPPEEHIASIFKEYTTPTRVLRSFTNLSNTVIQTALSGQSKFVFEILQNADDAFEDQHKEIDIKFILQGNYLIVHHNGKGFDYNDVERICDYASQIEEVKATDLRKTGYKGLGFKSLFNLSDCIHIVSNGYAFRFDKTYWPDSESVPWQVIPIWCRYNELPLSKKYPYDQPVNLILKVTKASQLEGQLIELIKQPELLLYLHRINKFSIILNEEENLLERRIEKFGVFNKINFYKNNQVESCWLSRTYKRSVHGDVQKFVRGASRFIYPDKIKRAREVRFTFALRSDENLQEVSTVNGLCFSTLPTQLHLTLPYHTNSLFILNLDRTQLHENEWNEFLLHQLGSLQFYLLKDLAEVDHLKNYVIRFFVREINHLYCKFGKAFLKGFTETKFKVGWLPPNYGPQLLKLGEAWTDETEFFKQNFQNIRDHNIYPFLVNYDVKYQEYLLHSEGEVKRFTYDQLFREFPYKYYPQLTRNAYVRFISYLYERLKGPPFHTKVTNKLKNVFFLRAKDGQLLSPKNALLEESENPIPDFLGLNPVDNGYLPSNNINSIMNWLSQLGAKRLMTPVEVLRESILKWMESGDFDVKITKNNHVGIINYIFEGYEQLTRKEMEKVRDKLIIFTESGEFKLANLCYLPDAVPVKELSDVITNREKVSSSYDINKLKGFFTRIGVHSKIKPLDTLRKSILVWIKTGEIKDKLTIRNYSPIMEYVASFYSASGQNLTESEKTELKKMLVLTCGQVFQRAQVCYFDYAIPKVRGLEFAIANDKLVSTKNISKNLHDFLLSIGVSEKIVLVDVLRRTVLRWIQEGQIRQKITQENHKDILKFIGEQWYSLHGTSGLKPKEKNDLKRFPILTEGNVFRAANTCYWSISNLERSCSEEIPGLKSVISSDEFVSSDYQSKFITTLLADLGVRNLTFTDIYEKYSDHLTHRENVKWFFSQLVNYWNRNKADKDQLLSCLQQKLKASSCLLAKNGKLYSSTELYSSQFESLYEIDPNAIFLLQYKSLPGDLERFLGFKTDLDFRCIKQLLKALDRKTGLGKDKTQILFTVLLEQLRRKDKNEIRKSQLSLLSSNNKLKLAKDLYYFVEEEAVCFLDSCYLKRIPGMSHKETLELADLCGVTILPFKQEVTQEDKRYDNTLQEFYLKRLSFIVAKESKTLFENVNTILKQLYERICAIKLYQCQTICVKYPFGDVTWISHHFDDLTIYVVGKWGNKKSIIHEHLKKALKLEADIRDIIDMEFPISESDKQELLAFSKLEPDKLHFVEEQFKKLLSGEEEKVSSEITHVESIIAQSPLFEHEKKKIKVNEIVVMEMEEFSSDSEMIQSDVESATSSDSEVAHSGSEIDSDENLIEHPCSAANLLKSSREIEQDIKLHKPKLVELIPVERVNNAQFHPSKNESENAVENKIVPHPLKDEVKNIIESKVVPHLPKGEVENTIENKILSHPSKVRENIKESKVIKTEEVISEPCSSDESPVSSLLDESLLQKPYSTAEELKKLLFHEERKKLNPVKIINIAQPQLTKSEEINRKKLTLQKEGIDDAKYSSSDDSSVDNVVCEPCVVKTNAAEIEESKICDTFIDKQKVMTDLEATVQFVVKEDIVKSDTGISIPIELKNHSLSRSAQPEISGIYSSLEYPCIRESVLLQDTNSGTTFIQWLNEKFVFSFLQDHYKNKYPNSQSSLSSGIFTLQWQSHKMEIVWMNVNGEKGQSYDLLLKKEGKIRWFIKVNVENNPINIDDSQFFMDNNQIAAELSKFKDKYCVYHVFHKNISSKLNIEEMKNSAELYKVVPLKSA